MDEAVGLQRLLCRERCTTDLAYPAPISTIYIFHWTGAECACVNFGGRPGMDETMGLQRLLC
jgi:hypothetical protein